MPAAAKDTEMSPPLSRRRGGGTKDCISRNKTNRNNPPSNNRNHDDRGTRRRRHRDEDDDRLILPKHPKTKKITNEELTTTKNDPSLYYLNKSLSAERHHDETAPHQISPSSSIIRGSIDGDDDEESQLPLLLDHCRDALSPSSSLSTRLDPKNDDRRDNKGWSNPSTTRRRRSRDSRGETVESAVRLYVGRLPKGIQETDLRPTFQAFGPIQDIDVINYADPKRRCECDCAFVTYCHASDARKAQLALNDSPAFPGGARSTIEVAMAREEQKGKRSGDDTELSRSAVVKRSSIQNVETHRSASQSRKEIRRGDTATRSWNDCSLADSTATYKLVQTHPEQGDTSPNKQRCHIPPAAGAPLSHDNDSQKQDMKRNHGENAVSNTAHRTADYLKIINSKHGIHSYVMRTTVEETNQGNHGNELTMLSNLSKKLQHTKQLERTNEGLRRQLAQEKQKNKTAESTVKGLEKELATLKTRNQWIEDKHRALLMQVQQLKEEKEALSQQSHVADEELEREAMEAKRQVEQLQQELGELQQRQGVQDMQHERERLRAKVEEAVRNAFEEQLIPIKQEST